MFHRQEIAVNKATGVPIPGVIVRLFDANDAPVPLYSDANGTPIVTVSGIADAAVADDAGNYSYYVANGIYTERLFIGDGLAFSIPNLICQGLVTTIQTPTFAGAGSITSSAETNLVIVSGTDAIGDDGTGRQFAYDASVDADYVAANPDTSFVDGSGRGFKEIPGASAAGVTTALASTAPGKGAALVGFRQAGAGAVARTVEEKAREVRAVTDFGATGDGTTADDAAIQAAIDAFTATGELFIPKGTYKLTDTIVVQMTTDWAGIHVHGVGPESKLVWAGGDDKPMIHVRGNGTSGSGYNTKALIENIQLYGESFTGDDYSGVVGIQIADTPENTFSGVCNLTIRNVLIRRVGSGIVGYYESDEVSINHCLVKEFVDYGIRNQHGGSGWWINHNHITDGASGSTGVRTSLVGGSVRDNIIQGEGFEVAIQVDGGADEGRALDICGNYLESQAAGSYGIILYGVDTAVIESNSFQGFPGATLIALADVDGQSCRNVRIGPNRHSVSGGNIAALASATSGSLNCQITGKQETVVVDSETKLITGNGAVTTISGPFTFKNFDGIAEVSQGVKFPATQNPSSDANTLDDYEEGAITLGIKAGSTAQTAASFGGKYTKIGRVVHVAGAVAMTGAVTGTGGLTITGLPFAVSGYAAAAISASNLTYSGHLSAYAADGESALSLLQTTEAGARSQLTNTNLSSSTEVDLSFTYMAAS